MLNLEQFVSEKCKVTSTLRALDVVEQNIVLILPDTQSLSHAVTVSYTKTCGSVEVMTAMWSCQ